ncbi:MAG: C-GCAxxG-C-C family protein [Thermodesulfobacteriota bacterium]|nr:MAG: C-GCAxxG-C-C family protein [Thermodesulfobacteriota bacterium]
MLTGPERCVEEFRNGYNCSQALLAAYSKEVGLDKETALKVSSAFGGGMGCEGNVCGAATGALMVLGLKYGNASAERGQSRSYDRAKDFLGRFRERNGSTLCKELLDCDISTEEGMERATRDNLFTTVCPKIVRDAAEIVEGML